MALRFEEFTAPWIPAVRDLNRRIGSALPPDLLFPESPLNPWLPKGAHPALFHEAFLALEDSTVRGGYFFKHQDFFLNGAARRVSAYRIPVSEGAANRAYAPLALLILRDAVRRQPFLFSLGMGGLDRPLPKMQKALGWKQYVVPFYFRILHGGRFLRNIHPLRSTPARRFLFNAAAFTGAASLASAAFRLLRHPRLPAGITFEPFEQFGSWADTLAEQTRTCYTLLAIRNRDTLSTLYPPNSPFLRLLVFRRSHPIGWTVSLLTPMHNHKQFGDMRVATIVDGLAHPGDVPTVLAATTRMLESLRPDLIISNQTHHAWTAGLAAAGFFPGPSNFIFSAAPQLAQALAPFESQVPNSHINRGDGDGPIHL